MANLDREAASAAGHSQAAPSRLRMGAWGRGALRFAATLVVAAAAAALGWFA